MLLVRVADVAALEQAIGRINRIRGVARTRTTVVLSTRFEGRRRTAVRLPESRKGNASGQIGT
jgi:Lrp/AsnC family leucine-responsive transcriptional regulator